MTSLIITIGLISRLFTTLPPCQAKNYPGSTGEAKIRAAIADTYCNKIYIDPIGPDASNKWNVSADLVLKSNLEIYGTGSTIIQATGTWTGAGMLKGQTLSNINIHDLTFDGGTTVAPNGFWMQGMTNVTIQNVTLRNINGRCIHLNTVLSTDVTIQNNTFSGCTAIGVRTDTTLDATYHVRITVRDNIFSAGNYGVALADCGNTANNTCIVQHNFIQSPLLSCVDFNRANYSFVSNNTCYNSSFDGITVDDVNHSLFTGNWLNVGARLGFALANAAVVANKPWNLSFNLVTGNDIRNDTSTALYLGSDANSDTTDNNSFTNNNSLSNGAACGKGAVGNTNTTFANNTGQTCTP